MAGPLYDKEEIMNPKLKQFIYGVILLGGGVIIGRMIGTAEAYKETASTVSEMYFTGASSNLNLHISLLNLLKKNETEKCQKFIESLVDADLIALAEYSKVPGKDRKDEILKPIEKAKEYRQKHPSNSSGDVSATIKKTLDLVK